MAQKFDARQTISRDVLSQLLGVNGTELDDLLRAINKEFNAPLRMSATFPTADSKLNFEASEVEATNLTGKSVGPIAASIPSFAATTIDFQTGTVIGGTVSITFPNSTIGFYRRVGFSLRKDSTLEAVFSAESGTLGGLADPGTLFIEGAIPIGWLDLEATATSPGRFKTAGSSTSIIENKVSSSQRIHCITSLNYNQQEIQFSVANDNSTGSATLSTPTTGIIRLTSGSLTSIAGITASSSGRFLIIENKTGNTIFVNNEDATATAVNRIQTGANGNISMTNNASFLFVYDATTSRWQLVGGTGSGAGGGAKNYLGTVNNVNGNGNFELGSTTGWSKTHSTLDSTTKLPNQASGSWTSASANLAFTAVTSGKLAGSYSGQLQQTSGNSVAGDMVISDAFTLDTEDLAKPLSFKFSYQLTAGAANTNFSGTSSNSVGVAIYDVTAGAWIQPAGVFNLVQNSGVGIATGTFQPPITSTQLRFAVYFPNASTGTFTMLVDSLFVGPQITAAGAAISDWQSYTPTIAGLGTPTGVTFFYRRVGDSLEVTGSLVAGTVSGSNVSISLPSGMVVDTSKTLTLMRIGDVSVATSSVYAAMVDSASSTTAFYVYNNNIDTKLTGTNWGSSNKGGINVLIPIAGWSSNTVMSNDTDTRVVDARFTTSTARTINNTSPTIVYENVVKDSHGAYNSSTGAYTVPVSGDYSIQSYFRTAGHAETLGNVMLSTVYKNGSYVCAIAGIRATTTSSIAYEIGGATTITDLKAGDVLTFRTYSDTATTLASGATEANYISLFRLSGPATIAASESVNCRYTTAAGQAINNTAPIVIFGTKSYDSHNAMNSSTGVFTAPISGKYRVSTKGVASAAAYATNQEITYYIYKNGSIYSELGRVYGNGSSVNLSTWGSDVVSLLAGDTVTINCYSTIANTLYADSVQNYVAIEKIGN